MSFISNFEEQPNQQVFLDKSQQQVVAEIFQKMKKIDLWERNWQEKLNEDFSNQSAINSQLWECLVALYLDELTFSPNRFSQASTNLDFGFSVDGRNHYGECICVFDGIENEIHGIHRTKEEDFKLHPSGFGMQVERDAEVGDLANRVGLRITNVLIGKNDQVGKFFTFNENFPTILFLTSSQLSEQGIPISKFPTLPRLPMPMLSSVVAAVYGVDGRPSMNLATKEFLANCSSTLNKSGKRIIRNLFLNENIKNISAVFHFSGNLQDAARAYLDGEPLSNIFSNKAEFIVNLTCSEDLRLRSIGQFPSVKVLWVNPEKTHIVLQQNDKSCLIRMVEKPA